MGTKVGLWIDHRQAKIIILTDDGAQMKLIKSDVEKHLRAADPSIKGPFKARQIPADDKHEREFKEHINIYYKEIIEYICDAEAILIFGPGEAKNELKKQLERNNLSGRIIGVEAARKMTDNQIMAKVCKYFNVTFDAGVDEIESPHQRMKVNPTRPLNA
jgi:hypothetical protein